MGIDRAGISQVSRPNGSSVIVFSYGSNMLSTRILERAPSATAMGIGQLVGFELCWNKRSDDKSGKCSVTETGHPQRVVWGVVHEMSAEDKLNHDKAEGLGQGYGERLVKISTQAGQLRAMIYYATSISPGLRPYDWYRDLVVAGAREHGLPEEYVRVVASVPTMTDYDLDRAKRARRFLPSG